MFFDKNVDARYFDKFTKIFCVLNLVPVVDVKKNYMLYVVQKILAVITIVLILMVYVWLFPRRVQQLKHFTLVYSIIDTLASCTSMLLIVMSLLTLNFHKSKTYRKYLRIILKTNVMLSVLDVQPPPFSWWYYWKLMLCKVVCPTILYVFYFQNSCSYGPELAHYALDVMLRYYSFMMVIVISTSVLHIANTFRCLNNVIINDFFDVTVKHDDPTRVIKVAEIYTTLTKQILHFNVVFGWITLLLTFTVITNYLFFIQNVLFTMRFKVNTIVEVILVFWSFLTFVSIKNLP